MKAKEGNGYIHHTSSRHAVSLFLPVKIMTAPQPFEPEEAKKYIDELGRLIKQGTAGNEDGSDVVPSSSDEE